VFEMTLEEIADAFTRGESVRLRSFGAFNVRSKRERIGRNPKTGIEAPIRPRRVVTFKASPVLIARANNMPFAHLERRGDPE
jgi:integration host factor subunit alpha